MEWMQMEMEMEIMNVFGGAGKNMCCEQMMGFGAKGNEKCGNKAWGGVFLYFDREGSGRKAFVLDSST